MSAGQSNVERRVMSPGVSPVELLFLTVTLRTNLNAELGLVPLRCSAIVMLKMMISFSSEYLLMLLLMLLLNHLSFKNISIASGGV